MAQTASGDDVASETWSRFSRELVRAGRADARTAERLRSVRAQYRAPPPGGRIDVRVETRASDPTAVVEVEAHDRVGLLSELARAFAELGMDVRAAKVATYGPRVVDVFYATPGAAASWSSDVVSGLRRALLDVARG